MTLHIYTTNAQPATRWRVHDMPRGRYVRWPANCLLRCLRCNKRRRAKNCNVKAYYDTTHVFCARGGCAKEPK